MTVTLHHTSTKRFNRPGLALLSSPLPPSRLSGRTQQERRDSMHGWKKSHTSNTVDCVVSRVNVLPFLPSPVSTGGLLYPPHPDHPGQTGKHVASSFHGHAAHALLTAYHKQPQNHATSLPRAYRAANPVAEALAPTSSSSSLRWYKSVPKPPSSWSTSRKQQLASSLIFEGSSYFGLLLRSCSRHNQQSAYLCVCPSVCLSICPLPHAHEDAESSIPKAVPHALQTLLSPLIHLGKTSSSVFHTEGFHHCALRNHTITIPKHQSQSQSQSRSPSLPPSLPLHTHPLHSLLQGAEPRANRRGEVLSMRAASTTRQATGDRSSWRRVRLLFSADTAALMIPAGRDGRRG